VNPRPVPRRMTTTVTTPAMRVARRPQLQTAMAQRHSHLQHHGDSQRDQRPATESVPLGGTQSVVDGRAEQRGQTAQMQQHRGDRRDRDQQRRQSAQSLASEDEVDDQRDDQRDVAAARVGKRRMQKGSSPARQRQGHAARRHWRAATLPPGRSARHDHHQSQGVPVADGAVEASICMRVSDHVGQRLAEKREYRNGDGNDKITGADETQLQRSRRRRPATARTTTLEQGQSNATHDRSGPDRP